MRLYVSEYFLQMDTGLCLPVQAAGSRTQHESLCMGPWPEQCHPMTLCNAQALLGLAGNPSPQVRERFLKLGVIAMLLREVGTPIHPPSGLS